MVAGHVFVRRGGDTDDGEVGKGVESNLREDLAARAVEEGSVHGGRSCCIPKPSPHPAGSCCHICYAMTLP